LNWNIEQFFLIVAFVLFADAEVLRYSIGVWRNDLAAFLCAPSVGYLRMSSGGKTSAYFLVHVEEIDRMTRFVPIGKHIFSDAIMRRRLVVPSTTSRARIRWCSRRK